LLGHSGPRDRLRREYGERIFAFEHRSATVGPLANACALAEALPLSARLHVVSFSAGGILAELLALDVSTDSAALPGSRWLEGALSVSGPGLEPGAEGHLRQLENLLAQRRPRLDRLVRIACPAAGTPIYGRAMERGLSIASLLPVIGPIYALIPGLDKLLGDPEASPGLTALQPGSGIVQLLASRTLRGSTLRVLAAVRQADSTWSGLKQRVLRFMGGQSGDADDLVVPLASALGGMERFDGIDVLIERGPHADHFAFMNDPARFDDIVAALLAPDFEPPPRFRRYRSLAEARGETG
jgi:hypothetical protein